MGCGTALVVGLAVYFLTPLVAEFFYEAYHLTLWDPLYTAYSAARYLTAQFMLWPGRCAVSLAITLMVGLIMIFRARRIGER